MNSGNLDTKFQSAYKRGYSTETTLLKVLHDTLHAADGKQPTSLVLLDLSAVFNTIDHEHLLSRLDFRFGINGAALQRLNTYLIGKLQSVLVDGVSSPVSSLQFGVPPPLKNDGDNNEKEKKEADNAVIKQHFRSNEVESRKIPSCDQYGS
ncbi:reverse transcriptase-like protein [Elysia marginata]|uniref:Reverse transcriptase-like protein n=1 Tax=Elysia marginata TaxID=1093978 RepID=A0AAV4EPL3_9GAST|nr:reverse transcriptase-like protein [Elysia marginata]